MPDCHLADPMDKPLYFRGNFETHGAQREAFYDKLKSDGGFPILPLGPHHPYAGGFMSNSDDPKTESQAKIIPLRPSSKTKLDTNTVKLLKIADEIDHVILRHVEAGDVDLKELAGLLSHRLGALVKHLENKEALVDVCVDVFKKQAAVDE